MIIVNILGGLGNQMFQYAFAYSILDKKNTIVKLDIEDFNTYDLRKYELDIYNVSLDLASVDEINTLKYKQETLFERVVRMLKRTSSPLSENYYKEADVPYGSKVYELNDDIYFQGYWQSEKYFLNYREALLKEFRLENSLQRESKSYEEICK